MNKDSATFDVEKNGYKKRDVDYYIKRLEEDFRVIVQGHADRLETVKRNVTELTTDLNEYSQVVPRYKSEIESLKERLENIRGYANKASETRYLQGQDIEVLLANLITQVLAESSDIDKLKLAEPSASPNGRLLVGGDFFEVLASNKELKLDEALKGFDFFDNNPFKTKAEKYLAKAEAKRMRRANR